MTHQEKIDNHMIARTAERIMHGLDVSPGDTYDLDIRFGDEGPDHWTRVNDVEVTEHHIAKAKEFADALRQGDYAKAQAICG